MPAPRPFVNSYFYKAGFKRPESAPAPGPAPPFSSPLEQRRALFGKSAHAFEIIIGITQLLLQFAFQVELLRQGIAAGRMQGLLGGPVCPRGPARKRGHHLLARGVQRVIGYAAPDQPPLLGLARRHRVAEKR